jgi:hypothetical protein
MKKLFFAFMAWLCLALAPMNAQNDIELQLLYMLSEVDTEPVRKETGILTDRVPNYVPLRLFDGKNNIDSLFVTRENFMLSYAIIRNAHVESPPVFSQDSLLSRLTYYEGKPLVPLGLMMYRYQKIKERAVEDGLIKFDGEKFKILVEPSSELFETDTLFMMTNLQNRYTDGLEVPFLLPDIFRFSNVEIASVSADFGDGNGYRELNQTHILRIIYPEPGEYILRFSVSLVSGEVLYTQSKIEVSDGNFSGLLSKNNKNSGIRNDGYSSSPDGTKHFGSLVPGWKPYYDEYGNQLGLEPDYDNLVPGSGAFVNYWLNKNCAEPKIRKPLIIISGFDPGNNYGPNSVINDLNEGLLDFDYGLDKRLKDLIHDQNYDIFFINYFNSTIDIRENAAYVKQAVEWINAQKKANGSTEKNIILGVSMGGLVSKWMLQEFEMNGEDHEAKLFMSFDSPMRGANIPLSLQALPLRFGDRKVAGIPLRDLNDDLMKGLRTVSSKAARQMLYYNLSLTPEFYVTPEQLSAEHDAFFAELDSRGELKVPYIPLSNGAINGDGKSFEAGRWIQSVNVQNPRWLRITMYILGLSNLYYDLDGFSVNSNDMVVHKNNLRWTTLGVIQIPAPEELRITKGFTPWDNAPGGLRSFEDLKNGKIPDEFGWFHKSFCFIPTVSALDLRNVSDPFQTDLEDIDKTMEEFAPHIRSYIGSTETSIQFEEEQTNQEHVSLNNQLATFLLGNLKSLDLLAFELNNRTFNFGEGEYHNDLPNGTSLSTSRTISQNLHVHNAGKLWINRKDKIAFTDEPNLANTFPKEFEVSLGKTLCDAEATEVLVNNGGQIFIGDGSVENTGILTINDGTTLTIGAGGQVVIDHLSKIMVKKGGTIKILTDGTLDIMGDGKLIIEEGGNMILENGALLNLEKEMNSDLLTETTNTGSVVVLKGNLHTKEGEVKVQGRGFMWIHEKSSLSSATKKLTFTGHGVDNTAFRFDAKTDLTLDEFGFNNAKCMVNKPFTVIGAYEIYINSSSFNSPLISSGSQVPTDNLLKLNNENKLIFLANENITILNSVFDDLPVDVTGFEKFISTNSDFSSAYKSVNINLKDGIKSAFSNCNIITQKPDFFALNIPANYLTKIGINCLDVFENRLNNSKINGFNVNNARTDDPLTGIDLLGIKQVNSPYLYINNSEIKSCKTGVFSPDGVNIIMDKSTIKDCVKGIDMVGKSDLGMVKMLCSSLENNQIGINGQDIFLAIDGIINSQTTKNGFVTANYFDNINSHFSICYKLKTPESFEIPARLNRWVDSRKYSLGFCGQQPFMELIQRPESDGMCANVELSQCEDQAPAFPLTQAGIDQHLYTGLCTNFTCKGAPVLENYWKGFSCFYNDNLLETEELFQPLAEEYFVDGNETLPLICKSVLREANTFVSGFNFFKYDSTVSHTLEIKPSCRKTGVNEFKTVLVLNIPDWAKPYRTINWHVSEGGVILEMSQDQLEITTNGRGKYLAIINGLQCRYRGYYNFSESFQFPYTCPPACLTSAPVLTLDENSCTLFIQNSTLEDVLQQTNATFTLQRFLNNQWINITNLTSFQVTEDGTYRYVVNIEGCDDVYSNYIITSCTNRCHCFAETLVYNAENCNLNWSNICDGFSVVLQRKNLNGTWVQLSGNPQSPFAIQIDGDYRLVFEKEGCLTRVSNTVSSRCALPGLCSCAAPTLLYNVTNCSLNWSQPSCSGFTTTLERQTAGVWSAVTQQSPYIIPDNSNGNYRLVTQKPGCFPSHSNVVQVGYSCTSPDRIVLMNSGILGTDLWVEPYFETMHMIPFVSNVCEGGRIEFLLSTSEVNANWSVQAENSEINVNWNYTSNMAKVYLFLPQPIQSGETTVMFTSPCGDSYSVIFTYSCQHECGNIQIGFDGNHIESCENLNLFAQGGSLPYLWNIIGEGSLGTIINQNDSEIDVTSMLPGESIQLQVMVTDANGCSYIHNIMYIRCSSGCNGEECAVAPASCGEELGRRTGHNDNAIVNYIVEDGISQISILFNPLQKAQEYEISKNGTVILYHSSIGFSTTHLICSGFNYFQVPNHQTFQANIGNLVRENNWTKFVLDVNPGDLISIDISDPMNCVPSNWKLIIECENEGHRTHNQNFSLEEILDEDDNFISSLNEINSNEPQIKVSVSPNPTSSSAQLTIYSPKEYQGEITIWNAVGQKVLSRVLNINTGFQTENIDELNDLPSGVYQLVLKSSMGSTTQRVIKID